MPILDDADAPSTPLDPRLGRIAAFDARSANYPIRALLPRSLAPRSYTWSCGFQLNQGNVGACVGFSVAHEIGARPVAQFVTADRALRIYHEAQKIDPWPGEAYEGTSVLAGFQHATAAGFYREYRWAFGLDDLVMAIGYKGPAVLGINWFESMFDPDANGLLHVAGRVAGGHAILANGVSISRRQVRLHNSWGPGWGVNGDAYISFADLERLLAERGEACIPVLRSRP